MGMEYNNINEHEELLEMREQIAALRSKLESQAIVSEKMILASISKGVSKINKRGLVFALFGLFAVPYCTWGFSYMGFSRGFVIGTAILLTFSLLATLYIHCGLRSANLAQDNMVDVGKRVARLRKQYAYWTCLSIPALLVWGYFLYCDICAVFPDVEYRNSLVIGSIIGGTIGAAIGLWQHFKVLRTADDVLLHIKELQE